MKLNRVFGLLLGGLALAVTGCPGSTLPVGIHPGVNGLTPVQYLYTTLFNVNAVMAVNVVQSRMDNQPILTGNGPRAVAIEPRAPQTYLYVVCQLGNAVDIVDRNTKLIYRTVNVGNSPFGIAISPDGNRIFVTNSGDDTVSVIDGTTFNVVQTIQLNTFSTTTPTTGGSTTPAIHLKPQGIATNANGSKVFVVCAAGQVVELDGQTTAQYTATKNTVLAGSVSPTNIAVNSTGADDYVYITDPDAGRLFSYDAAQGNSSAQVRQIAGGPWGVAVGRNPQSGQNDRLYLTCYQTNALYPLSLPDLSAATTNGQGVSCEGNEPRGVAVSPVGDQVYVSLAGQNTVEVFNRTGTTLARPAIFDNSQLASQFIAPTGEIALGGYLSQ